MRISTSLLFQRGVNSMTEQQSTLSDTQTQLATGERLSAPSDDPFASTRIIALDEQTKTLDQYQRNAGSASTRLALEETALVSAIDTLQRLHELAVQGSNGVYSLQERRAIALEVSELRDSIFNISNTTDASGDYIFSGDRTGSPAFTDNLDGTFTYNGDQGQRLVQIGTNREIKTGDSGFEVFSNVPGVAGQNIMEIANALADTLNLGNSSVTSVNDLDAALRHLSGVRSGIGARVNAIESQIETNESFNLSLEKNRSALADLDYADAVSRFQQELAGLQAAQQSFVQIQNLSLFNYL